MNAMHVTSAANAILLLLLTVHVFADDRVDPGERDRLVARGKYLVTIMDCTGCHTPGSLVGQPDMERFLAGSDIGFDLGPDGGATFPKNLTPDPETGLGQWTDEEVLRALRKGIRRDGRTLFPIMPWPAYAQLEDRDARAIVAYLRTIPAVRHAVPQDVAPGEKATSPVMKVIMP